MPSLFERGRFFLQAVPSALRARREEEHTARPFSKKSAGRVDGYFFSIRRLPAPSPAANFLQPQSGSPVNWPVMRVAMRPTALPRWKDRETEVKTEGIAQQPRACSDLPPPRSRWSTRAVPFFFCRPRRSWAIPSARGRGLFRVPVGEDAPPSARFFAEICGYASSALSGGKKKKKKCLSRRDWRTPAKRR